MHRKFLTASLLVIITILLVGCSSNISNSSNYDVSGYILDSNNSPISNVTLSFSNGFGTSQTDNEGYWKKNDLNSTVIVTPAKDGYIFEPSSRELNSQADDINFICKSDSINSYSVSGCITDSFNHPISDVTIHFSNESETTVGTTESNSEGHWNKDELDGRITITPVKEGYIFEPSSKKVNNLSNDINFIIKRKPIYTEEQIHEYNAIKRNVFSGWFNITPEYGYYDPTIYLGYNERTEITGSTYDAIKNTKNSILKNGVTNRQNIEAIIEILHLPYEWSTYQFWYDYDEKYYDIDTNFIGTTEWYIENETLIGVCVDRASTIIALFRAAGIPAIYLEAVNINSVGDFIDNGKLDRSYEYNYSSTGHSYIEIYVEGKWCLVDANSGDIFLDYDNTNPYLKEEIIVLKAMDNWEYWKAIGYDKHPYMETFQEENIYILKDLFDNFVPYESNNYIDAWDAIEEINYNNN